MGIGEKILTMEQGHTKPDFKSVAGAAAVSQRWMKAANVTNAPETFVWEKDKKTKEMRPHRRLSLESIAPASKKPTHSDLHMDEATLRDKYPFIIHPQAHLKQIWDMLVLALVFYNVIMIPLSIGFSPERSTTMFTIDTTIDAFFIMDIIFRFRCAYVDSSGYLVRL